MRSIRNRPAISVFPFDGSTAVFFLPPQKENEGGMLPGIPGTLRLPNRGCLQDGPEEGFRFLESGEELGRQGEGLGLGA